MTPSYKAIIPYRIKAWLKGRRRQLLLRRGISAFLDAPSAAADSPRVLSDLIRGWGNEEWSAHREYLEACLTAVRNTSGTVLECGSGLTTLLCGALAREQGRQYIALEHSDVWAARVESFLNRFGISGVQLVRTPLRSYGAADWYDLTEANLPETFGLVICDGPPGSTPGGRSGLAVAVGSCLQKGCVIMLDDTHRSEEHALAERWRDELPAALSFHGKQGRFARLEVQQSDVLAQRPVVHPGPSV